MSTRSVARSTRESPPSRSWAIHSPPPASAGEVGFATSIVARVTAMVAIDAQDPVRVDVERPQIAIGDDHPGQPSCAIGTGSGSRRPSRDRCARRPGPPLVQTLPSPAATNIAPVTSGMSMTSKV
jgi:hypothetical protein